MPFVGRQRYGQPKSKKIGEWGKRGKLLVELFLPLLLRLIMAKSSDAMMQKHLRFRI